MSIRQDDIAGLVRGPYNFDAAEANVFARELLKVRSRVFETEFAGYEAARFMSKNTDVNETDEEYTYRVATEYGTTRPGSSYTGTAPRAEVSMVEATPQRIRPLTAAYGYDFQEARIAARTGNGLPMRKARAARNVIAQEADRILTYGDTANYGVTLYGLANLSGTLSFTPATGGLGSTLWTSKTPDEILDDMFNICSGIVTNSKGLKKPNRLLLPLARFEYVSRKRLGDGSDVTILKHFRENRPGVTVEPWFALDAAPASEWTGMRMMAYQDDADTLDYLQPVEFEQFAPQMMNMETVTSCHGRIGGVVLYHPKAVSYGDNI